MAANLKPITEAEFNGFRDFIFEEAGITLSSAKKALVSGRLAKRLQAHDLANYGDYFKLLKSGRHAAEVQVAIDLLTTNETYFFREARHFDHLRTLAQAARAGTAPFRVWSAASSSGEEAYSIAMVLADSLPGGQWEVFGSDISTRVLEKARTGHYPMERCRHIPEHYLKRHCLKGIDIQAGTLLVERGLRSKVRFQQVNLNAPFPEIGMFDAVFLRNVMIYFNAATKREVVARILNVLKPGGYFFIGHSESLNDITTALEPAMPSVYRKPG